MGVGRFPVGIGDLNFKNTDDTLEARRSDFAIIGSYTRGKIQINKLTGEGHLRFSQKICDWHNCSAETFDDDLIRCTF